MKRLVLTLASLSSLVLTAIFAACHPVSPNEVPPAIEDGGADTRVGEADGSIADAAVDASIYEAGGKDSATLDSAVAPTVNGTDCAAACANLVRLGCPEGHPSGGRTCLEVCNHTQSTHLTDLHTACLAAAKSVTEVKACKSVTCGAPGSL